MNVTEGRFVLNEPYVKEVMASGGIPLCIPSYADEIVETIDGLLLTGGFDIDPKFYGKKPHPKLGIVTLQRDLDEFQLVEKCLERNMPIFGICRGLQLLNVFFGGTLFQHIDAEYKTTIIHQQKEDRNISTHDVVVEKGSKFYSIVGEKKLAVNSLHHQGIREIGKGLKSVAFSNDELIEGIERNDYPFCIAVQWHPEELAKIGDEPSKKLFQAFIENAKIYREMKRHKKEGV